MVGQIEPAWAAWEKGVHPARTSSGSATSRTRYYEDLQRQVMNSREGQPLDLVYNTYAGGRTVTHEGQHRAGSHR